MVVASHLLGEIERVCDFLVAIDAGRLLRAAPLGSFTERTGVLAIEVGGQKVDRDRDSGTAGRDGDARDPHRRPLRHPEPGDLHHPGHDRTGPEVVAERLEVHDEHFDFSYSGRCGYGTTFDYSSE